MLVSAYLSEDSVHILVDEVLALNGIVWVEVFPQASDLVGMQRRVAVATRPQQLLHHRRVELDFAPTLALGHQTSRHMPLFTRILSSSTISIMRLISETDPMLKENESLVTLSYIEKICGYAKRTIALRIYLFQLSRSYL